MILRLGNIVLTLAIFLCSTAAQGSLCLQIPTVVDAYLPKLEIQNGEESYQSIAKFYRANKKNLRLTIGDGLELEISVIGGLTSADLYDQGKQVARGSVERRQFADKRRVLFINANTEAISRALSQKMANSGGLITADQLARARIVSPTVNGISVHDFLTLIEIASLGVQPGTLTRLEFRYITNQRTLTEMIDAFREWKKVNDASQLDEKSFLKFVSGTQTVRYGTRIATWTGHKVVSIETPPTGDYVFDLKKIRENLEKGDVEKLAESLPRSWILHLEPLNQ